MLVKNAGREIDRVDAAAIPGAAIGRPSTLYARAEGGDFLRLDGDTLLAGRGYRTPRGTRPRARS